MSITTRAGKPFNSRMYSRHLPRRLPFPAFNQSPMLHLAAI